MTFAYTENGTGTRKTLTLDALEFLRRVLSHVLPTGLHKVRYFGWLHPNARRRLAKVQTLLAVPLDLRTPARRPTRPSHLPGLRKARPANHRPTAALPRPMNPARRPIPRNLPRNLARDLPAT